MKLTHTEMINASRETVFALLSDPEKQLLWRDGLVTIDVLATSPAKAGVGTQTVEIFHKGRKKTEYQIHSEVTALDGPDVYSTRISNDDFFGDITYLLEPVGGTTRLVSVADMTYAGNAVAKFLGQMAAHHNRADMKKLIRLAEAA
jgi:uncharacterized protein YndB with AHSA1/START domain